VTPTLQHVTALRELATDGWSGPRTPVQQDLIDANLATWDGGAGLHPSGQWRRVRDPGHIITPAGRAALAFYELGAS